MIQHGMELWRNRTKRKKTMNEDIKKKTEDTETDRCYFLVSEDKEKDEHLGLFKVLVVLNV